MKLLLCFCVLEIKTCEGLKCHLKQDVICHALSFFTLRLHDNEDIESVQTVGLHCDQAGKAEESSVGRGGGCLHRCCCFQRQNRELRNANGPDSYRSGSLLEALFRSTKRKKQLIPL